MRTRLGMVSKKSLAMVLLLAYAGNAAAVLEEFTPYVTARVLHDTNVFRTSDNEDDDTIGYAGAGLRSDLKLSRQHLLFDGVVERAMYDEFDDLDHTRVDATGTWAWEVGNLWSGNLGYQYRRELSSFDQQFVREKDMRTTQTGFFEAGYQLHPDWRLSGSLNYEDVSYQDRKRLDRDRTGMLLDVLYSNTRNSEVGVRVEYAKNDLQDTDVGSGVSIDNDYDEYTVSALLNYEVTGKSALQARAGYTDLRYDDLDDRDFQGFSGRLTYNWFVTGKTRIDFSAYQETSSLNDEIASYVLTRGVSVKPRWSATRKITLVGEVTFENDDFKGNNEIRQQLGLQKRDDDTWRYGVTANWDPIRSLQVSLGFRREERDSSIDVRDFDDDQYDLRARYSF